MDLKKNKINILIVVALIVVCGGSFLGVRAMSDKIDKGTTVPSVYEISTTAPTTTAPTTTAPTTTAPTTTAPTSADLSATLRIESVITTFPVSSTASSTTKATTTAPTTTETTTTEPTTERTTAPVIDNNKTTTKKNNNNGGNKNNGGLFGEGLAGYQYNTKGNFYYTSSDPWQRALGYTEAYDVAAGLVTIYMDTMRCKFEYAGKDWMIQFWKGQYGLVFVGHEIGVYTKPKDRTVEYYDAATENNENALYMELTGYRDGKELYHRDYGKYWWCTGFVPGTLDNLMDRSELSLKCRITMKDYDMLLGFCDSLKANGMVLGEDYATDGLDVLVTW